MLAGVPTVLCGPVPDGDGPWRHADARCDTATVSVAVSDATAVTAPATNRRIHRAVSNVLRPYALDKPLNIHVAVRQGAADVRLDFAGRVPPLIREQLRSAVRSALAPVSRNWAYTTVFIRDRAAADDRWSPLPAS
jgi:hypothetical protein